MTEKRKFGTMREAYQLMVPSARGILLPRCYLCGEVPSQGIHGGMTIRKAFICCDCEQDIVHMEVGSIQYQTVVNKLKELFI